MLNVLEDLDCFSFTSWKQRERYRYINISIIGGVGQGQFMLGLGFFLNGGWLRTKKKQNASAFMLIPQKISQYVILQNKTNKFFKVLLANDQKHSKNSTSETTDNAKLPDFYTLVLNNCQQFTIAERKNIHESSFQVHSLQNVHQRTLGAVLHG